MIIRNTGKKMFPFIDVEYNSRALSKKIYINYAFIYKCSQPDAPTPWQYIFITYYIFANFKIDHHEKYTLSDCSDFGNRLDIRILCIQRGWLDTHFDCIGRYFLNTWIDPQYLDFIL